MKLNMHDELISMELSQKMLEITAIAFAPMNPSISMKRKFSSASHHYRPHLTSASSNEEHVNCEDEDDDSRASSTLVGNGDLVKANSKIANDINLPSPPSSTRSSFDNDGITRDSFTLSNGDISENNDDSHVSTFGSFSLSNESNEISDEPTENSQISHDVVDDDVKFIAEYLVNTVSEEVQSLTQSDEDEELWKEVEIDFEGETFLPNGVRLYCGIADLPFYREDDTEQPTFTNQLNYLKTILTKYLLRYKTAVPFLHPVDSLKFHIPHYYKIIRQPMDLTTIKNRINFLWYRSASDCIADIRLIFKNCYSFNSPTDFVYNSGKKLEEYLEEKLAEMPPTEVEVPCPPRPSMDEYNKIVEKRNAKKRTYSIAESVESVESSTSGIHYTPIKMTTRSERGVMVRKPSKDLPAPISTPQPKPPSVKRVPLNDAMKYCLDFIKALFTKKHAEYAWPFWKPVSLNDYPDYLQKIKRPMDLSTIKTNIETGKYVTVNDFTNDMRLMFSNCIRYNTPESPVIEQARKLREAFEFKFARIPDAYLSQKLILQSPSISNSRTTSPSGRIPSASTPSLSNHNISTLSKHHSDTHHHQNKHKKSKTSESKKPSQKVRSSSDISGHLILDSLSRLNGGTSSVDSTDLSSESRMMLLEQQVATLRNALTTVLTNGSVPSTRQALIKGLAKQPPTPKVNGTTAKRGPKPTKKNGYQPKAKTPKKTVNARKRKHHLSSDEDSDSDVEANLHNDLVDPFDPVNIEDLKKLKDDLENLRAKDLQNVLRILQSTEPSLRCDDESNVEIDFEALKPKTLVALRKYVTSCMLNAKSSPSINQSTAASSGAGGSISNKKFCHSSSSTFRGGNSNSVTDCDNLSNNNWSRAGSRASNLQLSESSSSSDSELDD